jgi:FtsH-binding integral membrane protein
VKGVRALFSVLFWIYLLNAVLIVNHEIESAYWKEWDLFKLPGKVTGFLIIHFPVLTLIILGSTLVYLQNTYGYIMSILLSVGGIFAFSAHTYFIKKGRPEFKLPISIFLLISILIVSLVQLVLSMHILMK